jgi:hypothetical protein
MESEFLIKRIERLLKLGTEERVNDEEDVKNKTEKIHAH